MEQKRTTNFAHANELEATLVFTGVNVLTTQKKVYFTDFGLQSMLRVKGLCVNIAPNQLETTDQSHGGIYTNLTSSDIAKLRIFLFDAERRTYAINGVPLSAFLLQAPFVANSKTPYLKMNHVIDWSKSYVVNTSGFTVPANPYILQLRVIN